MRLPLSDISEIESLVSEIDARPNILVRENHDGYSTRLLDKVKSLMSDVHKAMVAANHATALGANATEQQETDAAHKHA